MPALHYALCFVFSVLYLLSYNAVLEPKLWGRYCCLSPMLSLVAKWFDDQLLSAYFLVFQKMHGSIKIQHICCVLHRIMIPLFCMLQEIL